MRTTRSLCCALPLVFAACGPRAAPHPVSNHAAPHAATKHPAPTPCPTGDALGKAALASWKKTTGTADATCLAIYVGGRSEWLLQGWWEPPEGGDTMNIGSWTGLMTPDGSVLWSDGEDDLPPGAMDKSGGDNYQAVDFDGDGNDEVLYENDYNSGGYMTSTLTAAGIANDKVVNGDTLPLSSDNSAADPDPGDAHTCQGDYQVIDGPDGTKEVEITGSGATGDDCAPAGRHVYRWNGATLVEVTGGS